MKKLRAVVAGFAMVGAALSPADRVHGQLPTPAPEPAAIAAPEDRAFPGELQLFVDASDVQHRVLHVREHISGLAGAAVLLYPRWLPGNHSTTGPIQRVAGLKISAGGRALPWRRDSVDMYAFHVEMPSDIPAIDVVFDYLSPTSAKVDPLEVGPDVELIDWIETMLYPAGYFTRRIPVVASLTIPSGWQMATALETERAEGARTLFKQTSVETLADSPVYAGRYAQRYDLDPEAKIRVTMNVFADRPELLVLKAEHLASYRALVQETYRLFGSQHFAHYDFLYALTDELAEKGLEHHQSSEDTSAATTFSEWDDAVADRDLLPHEFTHSWNGKFRRPADLWTPNYNVPMRDSLLWVYEGQTEYWGKVLAARSGLGTRQQALDDLALIAAYYELQPGREWRSLQDTTNDPILNHHRPAPWRDWQRNKDYYDEGLLIWLDVDTLIRERSRGRRSLDDFARAFFGIGNGSTTPVTYTFDDVVRTLNAVQPYDWNAFLRERLDSVGAGAPLAGLKRGGYRLVYAEKPSEWQKTRDKTAKEIDLTHSIGAVLSSKDGSVRYCIWGSPAFSANLIESTQVLAINGVPYDDEVLLDAIRAAAISKGPIELIVKDSNKYRVTHLDYSGGLRYPHLERDPSTPARLDDVLAPRALGRSRKR